MDTNLVVADSSRTEKTICLAVTPTLKNHGIPGRARLFEVVERIRQVNLKRISIAPNKAFTTSSYSDKVISSDNSVAVDYLIAPPRMAYYMEYSAKIYNIYLKYVSSHDIHVYSIDEVFMDVTNYLKTYKMSARELAETIISDVYKQTGITATVGIGTNLYLCKIAMDMVAKHMEPDKNGARIAELNEKKYREQLWSHQPLTDFWRVGNGYAKKLEENGIYTMGDIAKCSLKHEDLLYRLFGVNAELLIDHAWGWESCNISDIKSYKPCENSICSGQVLQYPYPCEKAKLVVREMADLLALDLVEKGLVTDQLVLTIGYDIENITDSDVEYTGDIVNDRYGRQIPKHAHGTATLDEYTSSTKAIMEATSSLFDKIINPKLFVRRINISANRVISEESAKKDAEFKQLNFFSDDIVADEINIQSEKDRARKKQVAVLNIKKKYGKNAIIRGMNLQEGATALNRNKQIGGHKA